MALRCTCEDAKYPGLKKDIALCLVYVKIFMFNNSVSPEIRPSFLPYVPANMTADTWRTWNLFQFLTSCLQLLFMLHRSSVSCCALFLVSSRSAEKPVNTVHPSWQQHTWEATFLLWGLLLSAFIWALAFCKQHKREMLFWHHQEELIDGQVEKEAVMKGKSSHLHRWLWKTCNQLIICMFRIKMSSKLLTAV